MITVHPAAAFLASLVATSLAAWVGVKRFKGLRAEVASLREDFGVIQGATLTLLALIIGFTFSMALDRYEQRKTYEEAEANAIGTEYVRADLLPEPDAQQVRRLLRAYLDQRVLYYTTRGADQLRQVDATTSGLQADLWSAVTAPALAQPTPLTALAVAGMNDVLNSQGYTQAAWWNVIPLSAWLLMATIAVCATTMVGIGAKNARFSRLLLVLPLIISLAFFLIADIDSPRHGIIRVVPENLLSLSSLLAK